MRNFVSQFESPVILLILLGVMTWVGCNSSQQDGQPGASRIDVTNDEARQAERKSRLGKYKAALSDYGLLETPYSNLIPAEGVIEYELNTPLFTDYAQKQRLIKLPNGFSATYTSSGPMDFPVGTIIAKTFYYAADLNDPSSKRHLVETRIMERLEDGWIGLPYVWNEEQNDARLAIAGASVDVSWIHTDGQTRTNTHFVPNLNDCKRCHTNETMQPIGPKANNLNRQIVVEDHPKNQLEYWSELGALSNLPELDQVPQLAVWNHQETSINDRARAYLEVNCAHCHNPVGPARNSGLHLNVEETNEYHLGAFKTPIAAGKGTGGRRYGIVPGKPDESILEYRMRTVKPGEIMPEFGKSLVHEEGLALIREWIANMN